MVREIDPKELHARLAQGKVASGELTLLDVRQPEEFALVRIEGSLLIPLMELESRIEEVRQLCTSCSGDVVVICRVGGRSEMAINYLSSIGVKNLLNLRGGINAYSAEADSSLTAY